MGRRPKGSLAAFAERVSGVPARFALPVGQAAFGAVVGTAGLYWDVASGDRGGLWSGPHVLIVFGLEAAVLTAAMLHASMEGPRAPGERPAVGRGPKVLLLVERLVVAGLLRALAP